MQGLDSNDRAGGVILHPTSLPGPYGIGDIGPEAHRWIDTLSASGTALWQVLPLGPTGSAQDRCPSVLFKIKHFKIPVSNTLHCNYPVKSFSFLKQHIAHISIGFTHFNTDMNCNGRMIINLKIFAAH